MLKMVLFYNIFQNIHLVAVIKNIGFLILSAAFVTVGFGLQPDNVIAQSKLYLKLYPTGY